MKMEEGKTKYIIGIAIVVGLSLLSFFTEYQDTEVISVVQEDLEKLEHLEPPSNVDQENVPVLGIKPRVIGVCQNYLNKHLGDLTCTWPKNDSDEDFVVSQTSKLNGKFVVVHSRKLLFYYIPSAGSQYILDALRIDMDVKIPYDSDAIDLETSTEIIDADVAAKLVNEKGYFAFTFVRDPSDNILDLWMNNVDVDEQDLQSEFENFMKDAQLRIEDPKFSSDEKCLICADIMKPQMFWMNVEYDKGIPFRFNFVGRFNSQYMRSDWENLNFALAQSGIDTDLLFKHHLAVFEEDFVASAELNNKMYSSPETLRVMCKLRWEDYTCFGFDFPDACTNDMNNYNVGPGLIC